ncbi:MAG: TrmB family transcriptional regulator [Thermofilum sp.]
MERLVELAERLGLSNYEAKVYVALLVYGPLSSTELAEKSEVPQPRIYDVAKSLMDKGLIMVQHGRPKKFSAVNPSVALRNYVQRRYESQLQALEELLGSVPEEAVEDEVGLWISRGYESMANLIEDSVRSAKVELLLAVPSRMARKLVPLIRESISTCAVLFDSEELVEDVLSKFDEVRLRPTKAPIMVMPDFSYMLVVVEWDGERPVAYKVTDKNLVKMLAVYYLNYLRGEGEAISVKFRQLKRRAYVHLTRALDHLRQVEGEVMVTVKGSWVRSREPVMLRGKLVRISENLLRSMGNLVLRLEDGREVTVGGIGAHLEDIEAREILIEVEAPT